MDLIQHSMDCKIGSVYKKNIFINMKSNEMWCYRFSRQCVASIVAKKVRSDASDSSDAYPVIILVMQFAEM